MKKLFTLLSLIGPLLVIGQSTVWHEIQTNTHKKLNVINFATPSVGYIGGEDSLLLKTVDGGKTWDSLSYTGVTFVPGGEDIINLKFPSASTGYMTVGPYSGTYKTTDGGASWTPLTFVGNMCYNKGLYFFDDENGFIGGAGCFQGEHIEEMSAGILSDVTINTPSWTAEDVVSDIDFYDSNFGLAVSPSCFLRTTDGGATWDTIPSGVPHQLTSIEIINDTLAYAGYIQDGSVGMGALVTQDAGLTWTQEVSMATFYYPEYMDVGETNNGYVYAVGGTTDGLNAVGLIFEDVGNGWWYHPVDHMLNSVDSYNDSTVFAVGDSGYVVTNIGPALLTTEEIPYDDNLMMVFPNPADSELNLFFNYYTPYTNMEITIWSISGQRMSYREQYSSVVDISDLNPGVYIIEMKALNNHCRQRFIKN